MKNASSCATCFMQWAKEMLGVTLQPKASFYLLYECRYHQSEMAGGIFIPIFKKEEWQMKKINLNSEIKVKLTPFGAEIFYRQYDEVNKRILSNGGEALTPRMPQIDKDGFTKFQLHDFINTFGEYMIVGQKNVIEDICIYMDDEDLEEVE